MFWTDDEPRVPVGPTGVIRLANLDGTVPIDVLPDIETPIGIALDIARGKVYWTSTDNTIRRGTWTEAKFSRSFGRIRLRNCLESL